MQLCKYFGHIVLCILDELAQPMYIFLWYPYKAYMWKNSLMIVLYLRSKIKVAKFQKKFSISSHLHENERNYCSPTCIVVNQKWWWTLFFFRWDKTKNIFWDLAIFEWEQDSKRSNSINCPTGNSFKLATGNIPALTTLLLLVFQKLLCS